MRGWNQAKASQTFLAGASGASWWVVFWAAGRVPQIWNGASEGVRTEAWEIASLGGRRTLQGLAHAGIPQREAAARSRSVTGTAVMTPFLTSSRNRSRRIAASAGPIGPSRTLRCARQAISATQIAEEYKLSACCASSRTSLPSGSFQ